MQEEQKRLYHEYGHRYCLTYPADISSSLRDITTNSHSCTFSIRLSHVRSKVEDPLLCLSSQKCLQPVVSAHTVYPWNR